MTRSSKSVRITLNKVGKDRCLFSVNENRGSGDLIVNLYANQLDGAIPAPFWTGIEDRGERITEYRYTVHVSPNSLEGVNTIKLHRVFASGRRENIYNVTTAIKGTKNFEPIFARLCSAMDDPGYDLKPGSKNVVSLGNMDLPITPVFALFLAPKDCNFAEVIPYANFRLLRFSEFSILLVWSYLTLPPTSTSRFQHVGSVEGAGPSAGFDASAIPELFDAFRTSLREIMISILSSFPGLEEGKADFEASTYLSAATVKAFESHTLRKHIVAMNRTFSAPFASRALRHFQLVS